MSSRVRSYHFFYKHLFLLLLVWCLARDIGPVNLRVFIMHKYMSIMDSFNCHIKEHKMRYTFSYKKSAKIDMYQITAHSIVLRIHIYHWLEWYLCLYQFLFVLLITLCKWIHHCISNQPEGLTHERPCSSCCVNTVDRRLSNTKRGITYIILSRRSNIDSLAHETPKTHSLRSCNNT